MSRGLTKKGLVLLLMLLVFGAFGCQQVQSDWVVQPDTESVKPRQGVTDKLVELNDCRGFNWKDEDHLYVYRYSKTVFGDDRGVASVNVNSEPRNFEYLKIQQPVIDFRVSPDGKQQLYLLDRTDRNQYLVVRQTDTKKELIYKAKYLTLNDGLSWNTKGGAYLISDVDSKSAWHLQPNGEMIVQQYPSPKSTLQPTGDVTQMGRPILTSVQGSKELSFALYAGPEWNQVVRYEGPTDSGTWLPYKNVERVLMNPVGEKLAIIQFTKEYSQKNLILSDLRGQEISQLVQNETVTNFGWSRDGHQLFYTILNKDNATEVFVANLKTGISSFVATYPGYGPKQIIFSPSGKKLMIVCSKLSEDQTQQLVTQVLTLK